MAFTDGTSGTGGTGGTSGTGDPYDSGTGDPYDGVELVGIFDPAGRPRGSGFVADDRGTVLTAHEVVDGLDRVLLRGAGERGRLAGAGEVTLLPGTSLALVRTDGLGVRPLPVAARERVEPGVYVRLAARGWRQARVLGGAEVTYGAGDGGPWSVAAAIELAIGTDGRDALRQGGEVCGGPVLDAETGAVLAVVSTALHADQRSGTFAVPLRAAATADPLGPLAELLERNAQAVPGYGTDLNLAGALQLTGTTLGPTAPAPAVEPVERADVVREFDAFLLAGRPVLGLVGEPGAGRTTELAALAARRARGARPAPTVWLRGADLLASDGSVGDAVGRALAEAARIVAAPRIPAADPELGERVAALAVRARRPLLVLLDAPEEMPPHLVHRLADWTAGTVAWLRGSRARLIVAGRPEHWERAGALYPPEVLHTPGRPARRLPPALPLGDLTAPEAALARARYGIPDDAVHPSAARHPLALRLLADVRAAGVTAGCPSRDEIFAAHLDLMCLRVAVRVSASPAPDPDPDPDRGAGDAAPEPVCGPAGPGAAVHGPGVHGPGVRRLAARVAGRVHEAARRCLGPGQGQLDRASFEELFPWRTGWASAVLAEGLLVPAGPGGYRPAHEELSDWLQAAHLDVPTALDTLVHHPAAACALPVPRHRIGPVLEALLLLPDPALTGVLTRLVEVLNLLAEGGDGDGEADRAWWAGRLLRGALLRRRDALPQLPVLHALAEHVSRAGPGEFGGWFWNRLRLPEPDRLDLLRRLLPSDPPPGFPASPLSGSPCGCDSPPDFPAGPVPGCRCGSQPGHSASPPASPPSGPLPDSPLGSPVGPASGPLPGFPAGPPSGCGCGSGPGSLAGPVPGCRCGSQPSHAAGPTPSPPPGSPAGPGPGPASDPEGRGFPPGPASDPEGRGFPLGPPQDPAAPGGDRFLDAAARRLARDPRRVQPLLCAWFGDERRLRGRPGATVATAAQALLHTHRGRAVDDLTEALVTAAHPRADELLAVLAEEEPSAVSRAVDRWAHDERPERRVAAAAYGLAAAPHVRTPADRELLRFAAQALLARPADASLHGSALAILLRDPQERARHLPDALVCFRERAARLPAAELVAALPLLPEQDAVFDALGERADGEVLRALAVLTTPALARRAAELVRAHLARHPEDAPHAAVFVHRRLEQGPAARPVLRPLVLHLLRGPTAVRAALAEVLAAPGRDGADALRDELADVLLDTETDVSVLDVLLGAVALGAAGRPAERSRELLRRTGRGLLRAPGGADVLDRRAVELARAVPAFGALVAHWLAERPAEAAALLGPSARRMIETQRPGAR
ncbi:serine protease [Streptomyces sp. NBC_00536]|uniref:serine protease n=1 Tax=Streptomyces sp. NBC_00536 TaxID=2975769 RepID=UPI002E80CDB9|nr:serine protease [Streptomyces sp. NBC_00536]WUC81605.1 serine protease [Streptomyces sp. NBC_00536]